MKIKLKWILGKEQSMKDLFFLREWECDCRHTSMRCNILYSPSDILCTGCSLLWLFLFIKCIHTVHQPIIQNSNFIMLYYVCNYARSYTGYTPWQKKAEKCCELCSGEWLNLPAFMYILYCKSQLPGLMHTLIICFANCQPYCISAISKTI